MVDNRLFLSNSSNRSQNWSNKSDVGIFSQYFYSFAIHTLPAIRLFILNTPVTVYYLNVLFVKLMNLRSAYQNRILENHKVDIHKDKIRNVQMDRPKINGV